MKLNSKVAIITGSASNIGRSVALKFARERAKVVVHAKTNIEGGKEVVREIHTLGSNAIFVQADLTDPQQVVYLFQQTMETFGTVDILVNNAGSKSAVPFLETDKQHWTKAFDDNLLTCVLCSIEAAKNMLANGSGKIINTTSIRGLEHAGRTGVIAYSAAKAAVINFTKTLAKELAPTVAVNAVAPGLVYTPKNANMPPEAIADFIDGSLLKRWLTVEEVADAFLYLAGAEGITGQILVIDGGYILK